MFTVELESDHTKVVSIDDTGKQEDIEMYIEEDNTVFIRQFSEDLQEFQLCIISFKQLVDLVSSLDSSAGSYRTEIEPAFYGK
jgi:hypothetical protein|tara:strand:+ start:368 stop:616 length:249 start_codon:yes stop_codon:yes gene_type:complete